MTVKELIDVLMTKNPSAIVFVQREAEWRELQLSDVGDHVDWTACDLPEEEFDTMPGQVSLDSWS